MTRTTENIVLTILLVLTVVIILTTVLYVTAPKPCKQTSTIIQIGPDSPDRAQCTDKRHLIRVVPEEHWSYARVICVCK